ncbi:uncharacterized protein LOC125943417 [Dermacentor silvarum]|uniref:uncharacterized protein LOC125943417 n=1 Tax=Dermacentor silvarum TaxID=543639 RepID=UPI002101758B|nr:uncharacterized protein LOC125943417 [Dermacentor silvarum]
MSTSQWNVKIFPQQDSSVRGAFRSASSVALGEIGTRTPNVSAGQWMAFLNTHLRPHVLEESDRLLLTDNALFEAVNRLLLRFSSDDVLRYVAWWFVQEYADIASPHVHRNGLVREKSRPVRCYVAAESRYHSTLFAERVASTLNQSHVEAVLVIFHDLKAAMCRLLGSAKWMDAEARKEAIAIVENVTLDPWLTTPLFAGSQVATESAPNAPNILPEAARTAFDMWLEAARQHKRLSANWPLEDTMLQRRSIYSRLAEYNAWWNSVFLHPSAVMYPLFYLGAPPAATYGGLGAILAQEVAKAFDFRVGSFLDAKRKQRDWFSQGAREAFLDRAVCAERDAVLMDVAALEALLEMRRGIMPRESSYYALPGHGTQLTPETLFFVTFCRTQCGLALGCNEVVRHVAAFGETFGCATQAVKCSFFSD